MRAGIVYSSPRPRITKTNKQTNKQTTTNLMSCSVCLQARSKYKCPKCRASSCTVACSILHKTCCQPIIISPKPTTEEEQQQSLKHNTRRHTFSSNETTTTTHIKLSNQALQLLTTSTTVQKSLQSKRLREDILKVETASNRQDALKKLRTQNPEFEEFVQSLVRVVKPLVPQKVTTTTSTSSNLL